MHIVCLLYVCTASVKRLTRLQLCSAKAGEPIDNAKGIERNHRASIELRPRWSSHTQAPKSPPQRLESLDFRPSFQGRPCRSLALWPSFSGYTSIHGIHRHRNRAGPGQVCRVYTYTWYTPIHGIHRHRGQPCEPSAKLRFPFSPFAEFLTGHADQTTHTHTHTKNVTCALRRTQTYSLLPSYIRVTSELHPSYIRVTCTHTHTRD